MSLLLTILGIAGAIFAAIGILCLFAPPPSRHDNHRL